MNQPVFVFLLSLAAILLLVVRFRVNVFVALLAAAVLVGALSPAISWGDVMDEVNGRFGDVAGRIGIPIAFATITARALLASGAADRITRTFVRLLGERYSSGALVGSGYVLSIPVWSDTVFQLLMPLARATSVRLGGAGHVLMAMAIFAGASVTHALVPPTPGPLAMAANMKVDIGLTMLVGLVVGLPMALAGWAWSAWVDRRLALPMREAPGLSIEEMKAVAAVEESALPGFLASVAPITVPVLLIAAGTVASAFAKGTPLATATAFIGDASFALAVGAGAALAVLARRKGAALGKTVEEALIAAGPVILITAAGGTFGGLLQKAGVGGALADAAGAVGVSWLVLGFAMAAIFKVANGSATVAMITVSAVFPGLLAASPTPYHPVYILMAIGSGSMVGSWMNDSAFWLFGTMTGLNEMECLKTRTTLGIVLGGTGLLVTMAASALVPLQ